MGRSACRFDRRACRGRALFALELTNLFDVSQNFPPQIRLSFAEFGDRAQFANADGDAEILLENLGRLRRLGGHLQPPHGCRTLAVRK